MLEEPGMLPSQTQICVASGPLGVQSCTGGGTGLIIQDALRISSLNLAGAKSVCTTGARPQARETHLHLIILIPNERPIGQF